MSAAESAVREKFATGPMTVDGRKIERQLDESHAAQLAADLGQRFESTARAFDMHLATIDETIGDLDNRIDKACARIV